MYSKRNSNCYEFNDGNLFYTISRYTSDDMWMLNCHSLDIVCFALNYKTIDCAKREAEKFVNEKMKDMIRRRAREL